ncbi:MAG: glycosyltransferase family 2 protein [candidate division Zixibacteria bacterium]|nr:glycosyltransferase family 2 protein [candidate division Zixibacteria bacterium]
MEKAIQPKLSIIIVSYNTKELLIECLFSVFNSLKNVDFETIVIDNDSKDGSAEEVQNHFPKVRLIKNQNNKGFAAANNQGLRLMRGKYAVLLNPDTLVVNSSLTKMVKFLEEHKRVGMLGCKIVNPDGSLQPSAFPLPTLKDLILSGFAASWIFWGRYVQRYSSRHYVPQKVPVKVGWVSGACLMIRKRTMDEIGLLDENFFLFSEDVDWCIRASRKGWAVIFYPEATIIHYGGRSAQKNLALKISSFYQKRFYFGKKHFGRPALLILKLISFFELIGKGLIVGIFLKMDSKERRARLNGYEQAFKLIFRRIP